MEPIAHGLWAAAAAVGVRGAYSGKLSVKRLVWWSIFADVLAFGPSIAAAIWLRLAGGLDPATSHGGHLPHAHLGLPLYAAGHSIVVFAVVFGITTVVLRRVVFELLGWLLHILIDIPTHSLSYYATRFLWPVSDLRVDGIAWWTPWFWILTYVLLGVVYVVLWRAGWLFGPPGWPGEREETKS